MHSAMVKKAIKKTIKKAIKKAIVVGAGMGGLTAALRLARSGWNVRVVEARPTCGGLASSYTVEGFRYDAGPYILLDKPGLESAFASVGLRLEEQVPLRRIESVYEVASETGVCRFLADKEATAAGFERSWPGSGKQYLRFVADTFNIYQRLTPLQHVSHPGPRELMKVSAWRAAPFLLSSLEAVLARTGLPQPVRDAISVWTHIAGQQAAQAPSPLAFVPSLIHEIGAYYPPGGIGAIPLALAQAAVEAGVAFHYGVRVRAIRCQESKVRGVELEDGTFLDADAVVSNAHGVGTYLELTATPAHERHHLEDLPLQSPGVCAYLAVRGRMTPPYLRFHLPGGGELCRLLIQPGVMVPECEQEGWWPARLLAPMHYEQAERLGASGQRDFLERLLAEAWWREPFTDVRVLSTRTPSEWGTQFHLYRNSMNPVMTAKFMRAGRLAHRSPALRGLYLAGSSTHPGQWVSFCAISGVLAADCVREDFPPC